MKIPIYYNGKCVGNIKGNTYYTSRDATQILYKYNSVNISQSVIDDIKDKGATIVEITLKLDGKEEKYKKTITDIENHRAFYYNGDMQRILPIKELKEDSAMARRQKTLFEMETISEEVM